MNFEGIKNIIFDLGNVIIDLDLAKTDIELEYVLGEDYVDRLNQIEKKDIFNRFEMGLCDEREFVETLQSVANQKVSYRRIIDAWNAMLLRTPMHRLEMLENLKSTYQVFLLSNTNETHLAWVFDDLQKMYGITDFDTRYFHKPYYSHLINLRKPNIEIYQFVLDDAQLIANETLFIDDNYDNIVGAKQVGINTIHHQIGNEIENLFK